MKKVVTRAYKFRLFPSKRVSRKMERVLGACRFLYNVELEYEKQVYFSDRNFVDKNTLNNLIPDWKCVNPGLGMVHSQVLQNVSDRLDKAFKSFFRRVKSGGEAGFPRFKSKERYDSFTFPQSGFNLEKQKLRLSKIGIVNIKLHRKIKGKIKTLAIKKSHTGKWFACFSIEEEKLTRQNKRAICVGIDVGLKSFYADSEGNKVVNPRWLRKSEERLKFLQRKHSKKNKASGNRKKSRLNIANLHEKIVNQRNDFLHKQSRKLANSYSFIAVEKLSIQRMIKNRYLSKSISDVSWRKFLQFLSYKVEETGGQIVEVDAKGTSQYCICGNKVKKSLAIRIHKCNKCGLELDRDVMSAIIIKALALKKNTVGTAGINACGDVPLGTSMKQECTSKIRSSYALII
ncbi:MAG: transposase [Nanoarchaeota archaeon]|nr:transposase [Nanoarchaeota archaeon]MCG2717635.1 transposase [Nanoarchaeota archaeon]